MAKKLFELFSDFILDYKRCGDVAWVIGSGCSLDDIDLSQIPHLCVLCNASVGLVDDAWWMVHDRRVFKEVSNKEFHVSVAIFTPRCFNYVRKRRSLSILNKIDTVVIAGDELKKDIYVSFGATNLLDCLGFKKIIYAGIDLTDINGKAYADCVGKTVVRGLETRRGRTGRMNRFSFVRKSTKKFLGDEIFNKVITTSVHTADLFKYMPFEEAIKL